MNRHDSRLENDVNFIQYKSFNTYQNDYSIYMSDFKQSVYICSICVTFNMLLLFIFLSVTIYYLGPVIVLWLSK